MRQRRRITQSSLMMVVTLTLLLASAGLPGGTTWAVEYTTQFPLDECTWSSTGRNPHFSIRPGDWLRLEGHDDGEFVQVQIKVLNQTKKITFKDEEGESLTVHARVVEEREWKDGELVEVSRNYYARCVQTGDVYYFGEDVDIFDGDVVTHDGTWLAGKDKALPGLIMPGTFLLGSRYYQERAPEVALDRAEHVQMGLTVNTPAGTFEECVKVKETTPLEPGAVSIKFYCAELGLVQDGVVKLVDYHISGFDD